MARCLWKTRGLMTAGFSICGNHSTRDCGSGSYPIVLSPAISVAEAMGDADAVPKEPQPEQTTSSETPREAGKN
jgi:hypothetical protein